MIEAESLTKRYGDVTAVDGIDLSVSEGTVYGFLGPNGAGKTTTIELLTTLTPPTSGSAAVAGRPVSDREAIKSRIGYLPAAPPLYDAYTGREQLAYVATLRGLDEGRAERRIAALLERIGLGDSADRRIATYSTGMKQKIGLLQTVVHDPEVVFFDEPISGLDPRAAREVVDLISELTDDGTTVFLSTHILPLVEEMADAVGVLHDGSIVFEGPPDALKRTASDGDRGTLEAAFLEVTDDSSVIAPRGPDDGEGDRP
ncbi:ABC transporter ATP-binding protein [Halomicrobium urmianum]|uniref:ABC transporter ATP-binding protein n=1 Tax=Halomicrobium urmianum TaxID=1586233 RepID=UPI001CD942BC|nr:ABC transporter ATP-binding protein [Halomicrobium urmianum]